MGNGITFMGKQVEVLLDLLQDHKDDMEMQCCEGTERYTNLITLIDHIEKGIN